MFFPCNPSATETGIRIRLYFSSLIAIVIFPSTAPLKSFACKTSAPRSATPGVGVADGFPAVIPVDPGAAVAAGVGVAAAVGVGLGRLGSSSLKIG
ncbi:hypothetical protein D3C81_1798000 [compost metagenome]